ncbi:MAG: hypothetical protein ACX931_07535 [Saccharospirillum sp.]
MPTLTHLRPDPYALLILVLSALLAGCNRPSTPMEVAEAFWQAVLAGDTSTVIRYSTLEDTTGFEAFGRTWNEAPELTRIVIEGRQAEVTSRLPELGFTTYLISREGQWRVDYERTQASINPPSAVGQMLQSFGQLGREMTRQLEQSSQSLRDELDALTRDWSSRSEEVQPSLEASLAEYRSQLQTALVELQAAIEQTLEENRDLPETSRQRLRSAASALAESGEALAEPGIEAIRQASQILAETSRELAAITDRSVRELKQAFQQQMDALSDRAEALQEDSEPAE